MSAGVYRFRDCRIDPMARELQRGDRLLALSPKVFDCLVYLIEHRDRAVGRDELISAVWGRLDVSDTLLGQTLLKARRAVGDDGNGQQAIRTVPRFGYRWIGELEVEAAAGAEPDRRAGADGHAIDAASGSTPPSPSPGPVQPAATPADQPRRPMLRRGVALAAAIAALLVLAIFLVSGRREPAADARAGGAVAADATIVLPVSVTATQEWGWLRLGMMDLVSDRLRRAGLAVVPSDNVVAAVRARGEGPVADAAAAARSAIGPQPLVATHIAHAARSWQVQLDWRDAAGQRSERVEAQADDPIMATRDATDRLLLRLGHTPAAGDAPGAELSLAELQQRTEAALLADDVESARRLIEAAPVPLRDAPAMRLRAAQVELRAGRFGDARTRLDALVASTPAESEPLLRARALYALGVVAVRQDRADDAVRAFGESIALSETRDEPGVLGRAYTGLAAAEVNRGRFDQAADALARARVALELAGDALALAAVDANEGVLDNARGRPADALPVLTRAAGRFQRFGALNDQALTVAALVKARLALLENAAALGDSEPLWMQRERIASPRSRASFELQRARALAASGRLADARRLLDAMAHDLEPGETGLPGDAAAARASIALETGAFAEAAARAQEAVAALPTFDEAPERARAWLTLVRALRGQGRLDAAASETGRFAQWSRTYTAPAPVSVFAALAEAEQAHAAGDDDGAGRAYAAAFALAERAAVPRDLATVAAAWVPVLIAAGELDHASSVAGRLARWADQDFDCAVLQARLDHALGRTDAWRMALARARALAGERPLPAGPATS